MVHSDEDKQVAKTVVSNPEEITRVERFRTTADYDEELIAELRARAAAWDDGHRGSAGEASGDAPPEVQRGGGTGSDTVSEVDALRNLTAAPMLEEDGEESSTDPRARYEHAGLLGHGGMGDVLRVRDRWLDREVAMKLVHTDRRHSPAHAAALRREARIIGGLQHPSIIPVYDLGVRPDGATFYTMTLVDQTSLGEVITRLQQGDAGTMELFGLRRLVGIVKQIAQGMQYAHDRGVVHRDLKPENVLIGELGEVQVMDWGIAKRLGGVRPAGAEGLVVGTAAYMSPEQAAGRDSELDHRSDIYSLGVILYEAVALRRPYGGESHEQTLEAVKTVTPLRPSIVARDREVPPALDALIMRMLAKDRTDRPQSMAEVVAALEGFLGGQEERDRRLRRAENCYRRALAELAHHERMKVEREFLQQEQAYLGRIVRPWDEQSAKQQLWALRHRLQVLDVLYSHSFGVVSDLLRQAVELGDHRAARQRLIRLYWDRHDEAAAREDSATRLFFARLAHELETEELRAHGEEPGTATLQVRSQPPGAVVYAVPFSDYRADKGGISAQYEVGVTPIVHCRLPVGPYILIARVDGHRDAQEPVYLREQEHDVLLICDPWTSAFPMIGREVELARLWSLLDDVEIRSRPLTCLISGSGGMGKNLLLDAFRGLVKQHPQRVYFLLEVSCAPIRRDLPYAVVVEMIRLRAAVQPADTAEEARGKLTRMVVQAFSRFGRRELRAADLAEARRVADTIAALPAFDIDDPARTALNRDLTDAGRRALTDALTTYFQRLSMCDPVLILVRNAQFMDPASRAFFADLPRVAAGAPILVVGTASDFEKSSAPHAALARRGTIDGEALPADVHLALRSLPDAAGDQLVRELLAAPVHPKLLGWLRHKARGNPFLAAELVAVLAATGGMEFARAEWRLRRDKLPEVREASLESAVGALIDTLPATARRVLAVAVVIGRVFWLGALQALGARDLEAALDTLVQRGFITRTATSRYPHEREYRLSSALRWRVAYDMLPPRRRRALHRSVAAWMARRGRRDLEEALHLAYHLEMGGQPEEAALMLARTARAAARVGALHEAMSLYRRVHVLTDNPKIQDDAERELRTIAARRRRRRPRRTLLG